MKIRIEVEPDLAEDEVLIRCTQVNDTIQAIQEAVSQIARKQEKMVLYKGEKEYYLPVSQILFFETTENKIVAHTVDDSFQVKFRLYELEALLPGNFCRVSKSTILNRDHILAITHNLTSSSIVELNNTHKQVYVSRYYYKSLKASMEEWRM